VSPKAERFVTEYLIDLNGTKSAIRAGYSERSAYSTAERLLRNAEVRSAIEAAQAARGKRTEIDADWVLRRLHSEATADLAALYDDAGGLRPISEWPDVWRTGLVVGIDTVMERDGSDAEGKPQFVTVRKVKLSDRIRVVELIGKHVNIGAFKDRVEHSGEVTISDRLRRAEERASK
jgi:phage terminase small subunit